MKLPQRRARGPSDWAAIRRRMAGADLSADQAAAQSAEAAQALLDERARQLAMSPPRADSPAAQVRLLCFTLGDERYALEARYVHEVFPLKALTPLPGTPEYLRGVTNLRGQIYPVFELRRFFGLPDQGLRDLARVLLLGAAHGEFGILADQTHTVATLSMDAILVAPEALAGIGREFLRGVTADALIVLDGAVLLEHGQFFINQD